MMPDDQGRIKLKEELEASSLQRISTLFTLMQRARRALMKRLTSEVGVPDHSTMDKPSSMSKFSCPYPVSEDSQTSLSSNISLILSYKGRSVSMPREEATCPGRPLRKINELLEAWDDRFIGGLYSESDSELNGHSICERMTDQPSSNGVPMRDDFGKGY